MPSVAIDGIEIAGAAVGVHDRLLRAAHRRARGDRGGDLPVADALGPSLHDRFVAVRRAEVEAAAGLDEETLVARNRWRF